MFVKSNVKKKLPGQHSSYLLYLSMFPTQLTKVRKNEFLAHLEGWKTLVQNDFLKLVKKTDVNFLKSSWKMSIKIQFCSRIQNLI